MKTKTFIILFFIFLLTFFLRVYKLPQFISYHQDQVRDLIYVSSHFQEKKLILLGPKASVGNFYLPPFWYYLMSISYLFSPSPLAPAILTALLSSLTIFFIFLLTKDLINEKTAYLASLIYSFSSLSIEYSRFAWNPNPIPLFAIGSFYFLYKYLKNNKTLYFILGVIFASLSLQLHYQGAIIFLFYFLILFLYKKINLKNFLAFILINFILVLPFIIYEVQNNFSNLIGIKNFLSNSSTNQLKFFGIPFFIKFLIFDFSNFLGNVLFFKNKILGYITLLIFIINLLFFLLNKKENNNLLEKLLNYFIIFSIFMFFLYKNSLIDFYLLFLIPFVIIYLIFFIKNFLPKFILITSLIILFSNIIFNPVYKKYDNTYLWINELTNKLSLSNKYCVKYDIFKETFIEDKIRYMFSINKNPPLINCKNANSIFYICEPAKCKKNLKKTYEKLSFKNYYSINVFKVLDN